MSHKTVLFKSEEKKTKTEIVDILRLMANKIEQGNMVLNTDAGNIYLEFPKNMILEIKIEDEIKYKTKRSLEIELEWIVGGNEQDSLVIS